MTIRLYGGPLDGEDRLFTTCRYLEMPVWSPRGVVPVRYERIAKDVAVYMETTVDEDDEE